MILFLLITSCISLTVETGILLETEVCLMAKILLSQVSVSLSKILTFYHVQLDLLERWIY